MNKIIICLLFWTTIIFGQNLDTIKKIEIFYGYGNQCFPQNGVYSKSEKFVFEKLHNNNFELSSYNKFWNTSKHNGTIFSKDSSVSSPKTKFAPNLIIDLLKSINTDKQNFSISFLKSKIVPPTNKQIKSLARKIDKFYLIECDGLFDCGFRNQVLDSIRNFDRFNEFVSSIDLTANQLISIGFWNSAKIIITSNHNVTLYKFSFLDSSISQPIIKHYNNNFLNYASVNLEANEAVRNLIPKNNITYKAFNLENVTNDYIRWYLKNLKL